MFGIAGVAAVGALALGTGTAGVEVASTVLRVGPARQITTLSSAAKVAKDGDTIEVDAGNYVGDVAVWTQNGLSLRAVNGRVRLTADGQVAEGKAIWVVRARDVRVQGFDFLGARASDGNGAGIRLESGSLEVLDCAFLGNENGILTSNHSSVSLIVANSEFGFNGAG